jgi:small GTP-binding protein
MEINSLNDINNFPAFIENQNTDVVKILDSNTKEADLSFKVIIIGDSGIGKTSLLQQVINNQFNGDNTSTVGFEIVNIKGSFNNQKIQLIIWDTCGQETFRSLILNYFRQSALAIIGYSITKYDYILV